MSKSDSGSSVTRRDYKPGRAQIARTARTDGGRGRGTNSKPLMPKPKPIPCSDSDCSCCSFETIESSVPEPPQAQLAQLKALAAKMRAPVEKAVVVPSLPEPGDESAYGDNYWSDIRRRVPSIGEISSRKNAPDWFEDSAMFSMDL